MNADTPPISNAMTVDVEDYFHVSAFADAISRGDWDACESRVEQNTRRLLDLFDAHGVKATFFVLGWVAERTPGLIKEIDQRGHEIACHGYSHRLVYDQTPDEFFTETRHAKVLLEDICGRPVLGYRAASYSITERSRWALDMLLDLGFVYDSSVFPVRHDRYGMPGTPRLPYRMQLEAGELVEFPLSTARVLGTNLPVAGGGYFRLYPYAVTRAGLRSVNKRQGAPFVFYLHPWEIDPEQPRIQASRLSRFRHYNNLHRCEGRLRRLLADFDFTTMREVLVEQGFDLGPGTATAPDRSPAAGPLHAVS
jgi:polysaccharide deacetylase family protein (PEP-CTERM system associated)